MKRDWSRYRSQRSRFRYRYRRDCRLRPMPHLNRRPKFCYVTTRVRTSLLARQKNFRNVERTSIHTREVRLQRIEIGKLLLNFAPLLASSALRLPLIFPCELADDLDGLSLAAASGLESLRSDFQLTVLAGFELCSGAVCGLGHNSWNMAIASDRVLGWHCEGRFVGFSESRRYLEASFSQSKVGKEGTGPTLFCSRCAKSEREKKVHWLQ